MRKWSRSTLWIGMKKHDWYMKELGMGNGRYTLIDIDHMDTEISMEDAVKGVKPFVNEE